MLAEAIEKYLKDRPEAFRLQGLMQVVVKKLQSGVSIEDEVKEFFKVDPYEGILAIGFLLASPDLLQSLGSDEATIEKVIKENFQVLPILPQFDNLKPTADDKSLTDALSVIFKYINRVDYLSFTINEELLDFLLALRTKVGKSIQFQIGKDYSVSWTKAQYVKYERAIEFFPPGTVIDFPELGCKISSSVTGENFCDENIASIYPEAEDFNRGLQINSEDEKPQPQTQTIREVINGEQYNKLIFSNFFAPDDVFENDSVVRIEICDLVLQDIRKLQFFLLGFKNLKFLTFTRVQFNQNSLQDKMNLLSILRVFESLRYIAITQSGLNDDLVENIAHTRRSLPPSVVLDVSSNNIVEAESVEKLKLLTCDNNVRVLRDRVASLANDANLPGCLNIPEGSDDAVIDDVIIPYLINGGGKRLTTICFDLQAVHYFRYGHQSGVTKAGVTYSPELFNRAMAISANSVGENATTNNGLERLGQAILDYSFSITSVNFGGFEILHPRIVRAVDRNTNKTYIAEREEKLASVLSDIGRGLSSANLRTEKCLIKLGKVIGYLHGASKLVFTWSESEDPIHPRAKEFKSQVLERHRAVVDRWKTHCAFENIFTLNDLRYWVLLIDFLNGTIEPLTRPDHLGRAIFFDLLDIYITHSLPRLLEMAASNKGIWGVFLPERGATCSQVLQRKFNEVINALIPLHAIINPNENARFCEVMVRGILTNSANYYGYTLNPIHQDKFSFLHDYALQFYTPYAFSATFTNFAKRPRKDFGILIEHFRRCLQRAHSEKFKSKFKRHVQSLEILLGKRIDTAVGDAAPEDTLVGNHGNKYLNEFTQFEEGRIELLSVYAKEFVKDLIDYSSSVNYSRCYSPGNGNAAYLLKILFFDIGSLAASLESQNGSNKLRAIQSSILSAYLDVVFIAVNSDSRNADGLVLDLSKLIAELPSEEVRQSISDTLILKLCEVNDYNFILAALALADRLSSKHLGLCCTRNNEMAEYRISHNGNSLYALSSIGKQLQKITTYAGRINPAIIQKAVVLLLGVYRHRIDEIYQANPALAQFNEEYEGYLRTVLTVSPHLVSERVEYYKSLLLKNLAAEEGADEQWLKIEILNATSIPKLLESLEKYFSMQISLVTAAAKLLSNSLTNRLSAIQDRLNTIKTYLPAAGVLHLPAVSLASTVAPVPIAAERPVGLSSARSILSVLTAATTIETPANITTDDVSESAQEVARQKPAVPVVFAQRPILPAFFPAVPQHVPESLPAATVFQPPPVASLNKIAPPVFEL